MNILFPSNHIYSLIFLFVVGCMLGVVYDMFRIKRMLLGCNYAVLFMDDLVFSFISSCTIIISVFFTANGFFRWFVLLSALVGFVAYKCTISKLVILTLGYIVGLIHKAIKLFIYPLVFVFSLLHKALMPVVLIFKRSCLKFRILKYIYKGSGKCL